jgi:microcompartment protein CcmL/EutN
MAYEHEPCIGLLELSSIARGVEATDAVLKAASVRVLFARPFSPGKYALLVTGSVDDVRSSLLAGSEIAGDDALDEVLIPGVAGGVLDALSRPIEVPELDAIGIVETATIGSTLLAADAACKRSSVTLFEMRLAQGIGGKSYFTLTGEVSDVEAATLAGAAIAQERGHLIRRVVVPRPHESLRDVIAQHERPLG